MNIPAATAFKVGYQAALDRTPPVTVYAVADTHVPYDQAVIRGYRRGLRDRGSVLYFTSASDVTRCARCGCLHIAAEPDSICTICEDRCAKLGGIYLGTTVTVTVNGQPVQDTPIAIRGDEVGFDRVGWVHIDQVVSR